jgi:hypothetical protein
MDGEWCHWQTSANCPRGITPLQLQADYHRNWRAMKFTHEYAILQAALSGTCWFLSKLSGKTAAGFLKAFSPVADTQPQIEDYLNYFMSGGCF